MADTRNQHTDFYDDVSIHSLLDDIGYRAEQQRDGRGDVFINEYIEGDVIKAGVTGSTYVAVGKRIRSFAGDMD